ncbi:MAG: intradiol ring-cleavage dioxygenase [Frankiales bacterium]|nr:intradiol ring-cleavage dioxygenase [Frankiales bacterium]
MSRTYEGRPLAHPDEDVVDQGLGFDLQTVVSRRAALRGLGLGAAALGLAACGDSSSTATTAAAAVATSSTAATSLTEIPEETAGPFPGDGSNGPDVLTQDGIVRRDITTSFGTATGTAEGVPMTLQLVVRDLAHGGRPYAGVAAYVWHCDREGRYSLYSSGVTDANYLRGVQMAGADGTVTFTSVVPACYDGRWPHVHLEVYPDLASTTDSSTLLATSQVAMPQDTCEDVYATAGYEASVANLSRVSLATDGVFGDDRAASQLPTVTGDATRGYVVTLVVGVDATTTPAAGQGPGGPPPGA